LGAPGGGSLVGILINSIGKQISQDVTFVRDRLAPKEIKDSARNSLILEVALSVGPVATLKAARATAQAFRGVRGLGRSANNVVPSLGASTAFTELRQTAQFLSRSGITDTSLRRQIVAITSARFNKLFVETFEEGKGFSGRLGNVDTRVATITRASDIERRGLRPRFEFKVDVSAVSSAVDKNTQQPVSFIQFVKNDSFGTIARRDELVAAREIEQSLSLPSGTVQLINTAR